MPGILIVHASLGAGHASAAHALGEAFHAIGEGNVQVVDLLDHLGAVLRKGLTTWYLQASEHGPMLYKFLYEASDKDDLDNAFGLNRMMGVIGSPFIAEFDSLVDEIAPEAIICTMQLPLQLLVYRKQAGRLPQPIYVVVTDYMAHSTWFAPDVTGYFVPSQLTAQSMTRRGVPTSRIAVTGIPVTLEVIKEKPMTGLRERHHFPNDQPLITLFGGGIEPERVRLMVEQLLESETPATLAVVAGRNERLLDALDDLSSGPHMRLCKLGKIDFVDDLVAASDLVITKAGGLIVSEILARGTPMIIIDPIPGQEEWNADLVASAGAGVQMRMPEMVPAAALYLLGQLDLLVSMRRQAQKIARPRAALDIAEHVISELSADAQENVLGAESKRSN